MVHLFSPSEKSDYLLPTLLNSRGQYDYPHSLSRFCDFDAYSVFWWNSGCCLWRCQLHAGTRRELFYLPQGLSMRNSSKVHSRWVQRSWRMWWRSLRAGTRRELFYLPHRLSVWTSSKVHPRWVHTKSEDAVTVVERRNMERTALLTLSTVGVNLTSGYSWLIDRLWGDLITLVGWLTADPFLFNCWLIMIISSSLSEFSGDLWRSDYSVWGSDWKLVGYSVFCSPHTGE